MHQEWLEQLDVDRANVQLANLKTEKKLFNTTGPMVTWVETPDRYAGQRLNTRC